MSYRYATNGTLSFRFCLAVFVIFAATFFALLVASGADKYAKPGGSGDGSDWSSAGGTNLANSLAAGDTLWLAGGNYGNGFAITVSGNATSPVTVKKATAQSHGSESGWNAQLDSQAVFNTGIGISGRYVTLDGNEWKPPGLPAKYGILIHHASATKGVDAGGSQGNITLKNLAIAGPGINGSKAEADGAHIPSNSLISGCAIRDTDALIFAWKGNTGSYDRVLLPLQCKLQHRHQRKPSRSSSRRDLLRRDVHQRHACVGAWWPTSHPKAFSSTRNCLAITWFFTVTSCSKAIARLAIRRFNSRMVQSFGKVFCYHNTFCRFQQIERHWARDSHWVPAARSQTIFSSIICRIGQQASTIMGFQLDRHRLESDH